MNKSRRTTPKLKAALPARQPSSAVTGTSSSSATRPGAGIPQEQARSRTFTGCRTCRSRHLKCDEARPVCSTCRRLNVPCQGYEAQLRWLSDPGSTLSRELHKQSHRARAYRYPLLTEDARASMSLQLVASLGPHDAGDVLQGLDSFEDQESQHCRHVGPFGVFRLSRPSSSSSSLPLPSRADIPSRAHLHPGYSPRESDFDEVLNNAGVEPEDDPAAEDTYCAQDSDPINTARHSDSAVLDDSTVSNGDLGLAPPFSGTAWQSQDDLVFSQMLDMDSPMLDLFLASPPTLPSSETGSHEKSSSIVPLLEDSSTTAIHQVQQLPPSSALGSTGSHFSITTRLAPPMRSSQQDCTTNLPAFAEPLLRYYKTNVLGGCKAARARQSPWRILVLPCALETFAELTLWNSTSHTRQSILYALVAKSAHHWHQATKRATQDVPSPWYGIAQSHQQMAQEHLNCALRTEFEGENAVKYTEILMSILCTASVSVPFQEPQAIKRLLVDAERVIRYRGLTMPRSFDHRLLHHMYTHLRILQESTSTPLEPAVTASAPSGSTMSDFRAAASLLALRGFRVSEESLGGSDLDLKRDKPAEVGYEDIHLDIMGRWPQTLYPDLCGLPESLLGLLSQTISLANTKTGFGALAVTDPRISAGLSRHIKTLEQNIWDWTNNYPGRASESDVTSPPSPPSPGSGVSGDSTDSCASETRLWELPHTRSLILAMHQVLIIYFYRRIYNMSAMAVGAYVARTFELIEPCLQVAAASEQDEQEYAANVGWSIFIAACEATTTHLQERGLAYLEALEARGVFLGPAQPVQTAKTIWQHRADTGDQAFSWPDLLLQSPTT